MNYKLFDVETDGLLDYMRKPGDPLGAVTKCHCLVYRNSKAISSIKAPTIADLNNLNACEVLVGHNIIGYDLPVLKELYGWTPLPSVKIFDTLVAARLIWTNIKDIDFQEGKIPSHLYGSHSLEAWGYRMGFLKGTFGKTTDWKNWSQEMQTYCERDTEVNDALFQRILAMNYSQQALDLEMRFAQIIQEQEQRGFGFNVSAALSLSDRLAQRRTNLETHLQSHFPPQIIPMKTPQYWTNDSGMRFNTKKEAGGLWAVPGPMKVKVIPFNPGSRDQIAAKLLEKYKWTSPAKTETGKPKIDETTLASCSGEEAKNLVEYLTLEKRLGQLTGGKQAWLKLEKNGRIHGRVNTCGAVTGRCTHRDPNLAQVPTEHEYRELFVPTLGMRLIGTDAEGLELRALGHFLAYYDKGSYANTVVHGSKDLGTDVHSVNTKALGLDPKLFRDKGKTYIYAFVYGAGDEKLGRIVGVTPEELAAYKQLPIWKACVNKRTKRKLPTDSYSIACEIKGGKLRKRFLANVPGLGQLIETVKAKAQATQWIKGIDGRLLHVRSPHSALNTLLQSAGAVVMKKALVILYDTLISKGFKSGIDFAFVANIHDEYQCEVTPALAPYYLTLAPQAITLAGEAMGFRCRLDGKAKEGNNWSETH